VAKKFIIDATKIAGAWHDSKGLCMILRNDDGKKKAFTCLLFETNERTEFEADSYDEALKQFRDKKS